MKKLLSFILSITLIMCAFPLNSFAKSSYEPTTKELESIIKAVRTTIEIPENQTEFSWDFNSASYYSKSSWNLSWRDTENNSRTYITCDSDGYILSYSFRDYNRDYKPLLPEKSPEDLLPIAEEFLYKIAPYAKGHLLLKSAQSSSSLYSHTYSYNFIRVENDIPVPDNSASVTIDYSAKIVTAASINYDRSLDFGEKPLVLDAEKAKEILAENQTMTLSYRLKTIYNDDGEFESRKAYLIYTPEKSYVSADAVTGKIYTERNTWQIKNTADKFLSNDSSESLSGGVFGDLAESEAENNYELSEKELEQLEVLNNLLTRDDAIKVITSNKYLYLDSNATAIDTSLYRYNEYDSDKEKFIWSISFSSPYSDNSEKQLNGYSRASVDAQTGKLISYSANLPTFYDYNNKELEIPETIYTEEYALETAESFLKEVEPERFKLTKPGEPVFEIVLNYEKIDGEYDYSKPVYRAAECSFIRTNEGVDFPYNSLNTTVDLVTGKIALYNSVWYDDIEFESPMDAISPDKALKAYYSYDGFGLHYEINSTYTYNKYLADEKNTEFIEYDKLYETSLNTRAVYSDYDMGTNIIGALTGKMLKSNGDEYIPKASTNYTDISEHWAKDIINRFSYAGIGFDGDEFLPDKEISAKEFASLLNKCSVYGSYSDYDAKNNPDSPITRTDAVKFIISYLGYEKVAKLENVFITDFADNLELKAEDIGFIAIARGFGLIKGDGKDFRPYDSLSRAEAMQLCMNLLDTDMIS